VLRELDVAVESRGLHAVGFLAYEAAAGLGLAVKAPRPGLPLAWFGLYSEPQRTDPPLPPTDGEFPLAEEDWTPALDPEEHARALRHIQDRLRSGDTCQVNFTFPLVRPFRGDAYELFRRLRAVQPAAHSAWLDLGRFAVASASPVLFFRLDGDSLVTRPMKGTAPRGASEEADAERARALVASEKERAENLMIVDMIRNDLGRVAETGSISVPALFEVERHPTLLQMTSTVTARSRAKHSEILAALFPCASVTGAPKHRTMQIIADLEPAPRGVYTGAIGWMAPGRRATWSVAIRTAVVDREREEAVYGVGSGIVADSQAAGKYAECLLEARVLAERGFRLLETLRFEPERGYWLLDEHLERLSASFRHFGAGVLEEGAIRAALQEAAASLRSPSRVRLLVDLDGRAAVETEPLGEPSLRPLRVGWARHPVDAESPWIHHKTTRREVYDDALRSRPDCDEVLLWNSRRELTEATRSNVAVEMGGILYTPPTACGLLPGTLRRRLLAEGRLTERVLPVGALAGRRLVLMNSVRGLQEAMLGEAERRPA
jgi:para-aminobenzoate synthetase / 4-amino-4-deoxychorismate lyase